MVWATGLKHGGCHWWWSDQLGGCVGVELVCLHPIVDVVDIVRWNGSDHLQNRVVGEYVGPTF